VKGKAKATWKVRRIDEKEVGKETKLFLNFKTS